MRYHISTSLILQEFPKTSNECHLCEIRKIVENNLAEQYLNEAVMVTSVRYKVNEKGFCKKHFDKLFEGQSKLGLALQCITRMNVLMNEMTPSVSVSLATKKAKKLSECEHTCVICDSVEEHMQRYYKTVAQLYCEEEDFRDLLGYSRGFCLHDYAQLVLNSSCAGGKAKEYVNLLAKVQKENYLNLQSDLQWFCDRHDFRNAGKDLGKAKDALPRTRARLYGNKK